MRALWCSLVVWVWATVNRRLTRVAFRHTVPPSRMTMVRVAVRLRMMGLKVMLK